MTKTEREWLKANAPGGWIDNLRLRVKSLEHELSEVLDWALVEKAPLRAGEIESIRRCLSNNTGTVE